MFEAVWIRWLNTNPGNKDVAKRLPAPKIMGFTTPVAPWQKHSPQKVELIVDKN